MGGEGKQAGGQSGKQFVRLIVTSQTSKKIESLHLEALKGGANEQAGRQAGSRSRRADRQAVGAGWQAIGR